MTPIAEELPKPPRPSFGWLTGSEIDGIRDKHRKITAERARKKRIVIALWSIYGVWIAVYIAIVLYLYVTWLYPLQRVLTFQYVRCQESGDAAQLAGCMDVLLDNMRDVGMTEGHDRFFFQNPSSDVALDYQTIITVQARAEAIAQDTEVWSLEHQYAMTELRDQLGRIDINVNRWAYLNLWSVAGWYVYVWGLWGFALGWLVPVAAGTIIKPWDIF